jgi:hypothetical protein
MFWESSFKSNGSFASDYLDLIENFVTQVKSPAVKVQKTLVEPKKTFATQSKKDLFRHD